MRAALALVLLTGLLAACMSDPHLGLFEATDASTSTPAAPSTQNGADASAPADANSVETSAPPADDAAIPPSPPAPVNTCPPMGAPAGTQCCGANGAAPPCFGMACEHCGDCVAQGCASGMICCAVSPGESHKYKGMSCRVAALAGTCPAFNDDDDDDDD